ncbi:hypothetical protein DL93DRAFT_2053999, partial [Clavulina sp. PMI_390]
IIPNTDPPGLGEPINVIISGDSDADVLVDSFNNGGLQNYFLSLNYTTECLGQHIGVAQAANLGDGLGPQNQTAVIRYDYGELYRLVLSRIYVTVDGGSHLRYWTQNGPSANTGAIFMALSYEEPAAQAHGIIPNGSYRSRDWFIANATNQTSIIPTLDLASPTSGFTGRTTYSNYTYETKSTYVTGLLQNTSIGINHNDTVPVDGRPAIDGLVAILDVKIVGKPQRFVPLVSIENTKSHNWVSSTAHRLSRRSCVSRILVLSLLPWLLWPA